MDDLLRAVEYSEGEIDAAADARSRHLTAFLAAAAILIAGILLSHSLDYAPVPTFFLIVLPGVWTAYEMIACVNAEDRLQEARATLAAARARLDGYRRAQGPKPHSF